MLFGATFACPACALRFAERRACPSCGGPVSPADPAARAEAEGAGPRSRTGVALAVGATTTVAAVLALSHDRTAVAIVAGVVGLATGAWLGWRARAAAPAPTPPRHLRVHVPEVPGEDERDEVAGVARRATVEVVAPLSDEGCLAYGIEGEGGGAAIDDAEGGDFDLVLPSGAVVMVSIEHAVLLPAASEDPDPRTIEPAGDLAAFLRDRGVPDGEVTVREAIVREGDVVRVTGQARGAAISLEGRARARVMGGDPDAPLFVQVISRGE